MRGDVFRPQRGATPFGEAHILIEHMGEAHTRQGVAMGAQKHFWQGDVPSHRQPRPQIVGGLLPEGQSAFPAAFAVHLDDRGGLERDGGHGEREEFGYSEACREAQMQHGAIPYAHAGTYVWGIQEGLHLGHREVHDEGHWGFLRGNGQYPTAVLQEGWHAVLDKAHERLNRGQAGIAGTGTVPAYGFTLGQKLHHEGRVNLLEAECRRPEVQSLASERE
jgi:hypothetical protein